MAEVGARGQQPSRLRYEMHIDSTDDEKVTAGNLVQAPDSQTVIPETQLDDRAYGQAHDSKCDRDEPLSPNSAAILDRTAAKKGTEKTEASPFAVKFLTKDIFSTQSSSAPVPTFSFSQAKRTAKVPPKVEATTLHLPASAHPTNNEPSHSTDRTRTDNILLALTQIELSSLVAVHVPDNNDQADKLHATEAKSTPVLESNMPGKGVDDGPSGAALFTASNDVQPSEQPWRKVVNGAKKVRNVKKGKKRNCALPTEQQQGAPWPPRSGGIVFKAGHQFPIDKNAHTEDSNIPMASPPAVPLAEYSGIQDGSVFEEMWVEHMASRDGRDDAHQDATHAHQKVVQHDQELEFPANQLLQDPASIVASSVLGVASSQAVHDESSSFSPVIPDHAAHPSHSAAHGFSNEHHIELPYALPINNTVEYQQAVSSQPAQHDAPPATHIGIEQSVASSQKRFVPQFKNDHRYAQPHDSNEVVLRDISNRNGAPRVTKTKKKRAISGSQALPLSNAAGVQGLVPALGGFEQSLESVRLAFLAEQYRRNYDHATELKHLKEVKTLLQDQINLQNVTIVEWKDKHDKLSDNVAVLREKARTNQKYVAGLQKDYQKLQKSASILQDDCKKTLQQKIAEVESEKDSLRHEFEMTLEALAKSQKNLRETIDDLYVRLVISESKRKDLAENLNKKVAMYEEEKRKRDELEKQLLCSFQNIQRQLDDGSTALTEKLSNLQTSIDGFAAVQEHDSGVQDCLVVLQKLKTTPFLTIKDVQKAEGMLRFVHKSLDSKLDSLTHNVAGKTNVMKDVQTFIEDRLQKLQTEMLKYEEVVTESRRIQQSNDVLIQEIKAQKQHAERLNEQIKVYQQTEEALKARTVQTERELEDLKELARDHEADPLELEREMIDFRQQLKKAEDDLRQSEGSRQSTEQELANLKLCFKELEKGALELEGQHVDLMEKHSQCQQIPNIPDLWRKIINDLQQTFVDKETGLKSDIYRLTIERDEKEVTIQQARERHDEDRRAIEIVKIELNTARKEKEEAEAKMQTAHCAAQHNASSVSEITNLKEHLRRKAEELSTKDQEFAELEREYAQLRVSCEQQQAEIAEHPSAIESMRQEMEAERSEMDDKARAAVRVAQNRIIDISKENEDLQLMLEQAQVNETKLTNANASLLAEKSTLRIQINEICAAEDEKEAQSLRAQCATGEEIQHYTEQLGDLQLQLEQSQAALKEAAAKNLLQETQHAQKLEFDRKKYESLLLDLGRDLDKARTCNDCVTQQQFQAAQDNPLQSPQNIQAGKSRKKVDRQNQSVLDVTGSSRTQIIRSQGNNVDVEHGQTLFDEGSQNGRIWCKPSGDQECSVVDPTPAFVEDTQETNQLRMSSEDFEAEISQNPFELPKHQSHSSTNNSSLSVMGSDEIMKLQNDAQQPSKSMLRGCDRGSPKLVSSQTRVPETPPRTEAMFGIVPQSSRSYDRPVSQANTASRLMPPPGHFSNHFGQRKQAEGPNGKANDWHLGSSPDYMQHVSSASKHTYTHHNTAIISGNEHVRAATPTPAPSRSFKRKGLDAQEASFKKQRASAHAPPKSRNHSPHPSELSAAGSRSGTQKTTTLLSASSTKPRSKTRVSSSSVTPRKSSQFSSSGDGYQSRSHQLSSSRASAAAPARRTSTRQTRSRSKTQSQEDRFNQELQRR